MAFTGRSGVPVVKARTSKLFQANTRSAGVRPGSPQSRSIAGPSLPPSTSTPASSARTDGDSGGRHSGTLIAAARIGDAGERLRQNDAGVGEKPAPVAGMMTALAQVDDQVDRVAAARAEKECRLVGRDPRPVGGDQQVGAERAVLVLLAQFAQTGRADFFAHLDQEFDVEAEPAALRQHRRECRDVDAVLALVVGGAAAVDAVAFDLERPWRQVPSRHRSSSPRMVSPWP